MSRRRAPIELEEIPTLKQAYEEKKFSPRNLKRTATHPRLYEYNEEYNKKISLIQADITKLKIDAIVNAANETLLGGGGVDGAIHRAAGPELRHECWDLNGCDTGDAKITKGYDLPSKHVIHTVGPVGEKPHLLRSAYERSMQVMCENNLKSIAFSNISTGVYGYPRVKAGHVALEAMRKWMEENLDYLEKLDRIIFCVFEDENKDVYESLFPIYFPPPADLDNYEKEEEIPKSKTIEEKKGNEAEKDKDQEKTTLTTEQVNNKEIIGTDKDEGDKEKVGEKATGQVNDKGEDKKVEENVNDKEKTLKTEQKDEEKKVEENDKEETLTTGQKDEDKKVEENVKEKTLTTEQVNDKDEDKKVKEEVKEKAQTTEQVNDKNEIKKVEEEVAEKTQTTEQNNEKGKDKDKEIEVKVEEKTQKTGQDNNENKNIEEKTHQDDDINKDNGENKDKIQVTDNSAAITDQVKDKTHDTNILTDHDTDMTDAKNNDEIYDDEIYDTDVKMREAITEQDENKTPDIKTVDATTEQNSKKRPHEDAETEQNDMNQNNIANSTMTGNTGQHEDVIMVHADDVKENSEPPTNVKENAERPINVKENVDRTTDVCEMESEPNEETTEPKTSKEENDRVDSPEVTEQTDNKSKNNSKI